MFIRTADQQLFEETTGRFLDGVCTPSTLRALATTAAGYEAPFWAQGAELGWTSLATPEEAGGGSICGTGALDLALVAYQFGLRAAPGPLIPVNVVAAAIGRWGDEDQRRLLARLLTGEAVATWASAEPAPHDGLGEVRLTAADVGGQVVLDGVKAPVEAAAEASHVLVTARHRLGLTQVLVPSDAPGLTITPLKGLDMTRRFARLDFDRVAAPARWVVGQPGESAAAVQWLADLAATMQLAQMCGAMTWCFETTVEWARNRYSFGRPLASYQEIKHRLADMKTWLEASYAIATAAARALDGDARTRIERTSAGKCFVGRYGVELAQDCVQLHGGIGVTYDHDLHFFLRRVATDAQLHGTPSQHARRLATIVGSRTAA